MNNPSPIRVIVERTATGFSAFADEIPVFTTGADLEELKSNMNEAVSLYFSEDGDQNLIYLEFQFSK
jgi:predicted RNase H-like HicB family nuclease